MYKTNRAKKNILCQLIEFDQKILHNFNHKDKCIIVGTDEVGRGCLAGPVVAAAVILPFEKLAKDSTFLQKIEQLNDSKKLSPHVRENLYNHIVENSKFSIAESSIEEIENLNILQASLLAMERALINLDLANNHLVIVDGNKKIPNISNNQQTIIGGDALSASIAAASIIAKVYRDRLMQNIHNDYPQYFWDQNKGYASKKHVEALYTYGPSPWHRLSFCQKIFAKQLKINLFNNLTNEPEQVS